MATSYTEMPAAPATPGFGARLQQLLPKLVLSPTVLITLFFVYGFIVWTTYLSFTKSRGYPVHELVGWLQYSRVWAQPRSCAVRDPHCRDGGCGRAAHRVRDDRCEPGM